MSSSLGMFPITAGVILSVDIGGSGLEGVIIGNESGLTCTVVLQGANVSRTLYAGTVDYFQIPKNGNGQYVNWSGNVIITPSADLNNVVDWPSSFVKIDSIGLGEKVSAFYPMGLPRLTNVGNALTVVATSDALVNNTNPPGFQVISIGTPANPLLWNVKNSQFSLSVEQAGVPHRVATGQNAGNPALLGQAGDTVECAGSLLVDQNETVTGAAQFNGSVGLAHSINVAGDAVIAGNLQANGTGNIGQSLTVGSFIQAIALLLTVGSLSRVSVVAGVGNGIFAHNLGVVPDIVIPIATAGTTPVPAAGSYTNTSFTLNGVGYTTWKALCIAL